MPQAADSAQSCCTVRHQKLSLHVDVQRQALAGSSELQIAAPATTASAVLGLHARGLHITQVTVGGNPVLFEVKDASQASSRVQSWLEPQGDSKQVGSTSGATCSTKAYRDYFASLEEESVPELLIHVPAPGGSNGGADAEVGETGEPAGGSQPLPKDEKAGSAKPLQKEEEKEVHLVHIQYRVEKAQAGAHFRGKEMYIDNQLRRARCWFPCVDSTNQRHSFDLEVTVDSKLLVVASGDLKEQVLSPDGCQKLFVYQQTVPIHPSALQLAIGPFIVLPDYTEPGITHMCMPGKLKELQQTNDFFHSVFSLFEEFLGSSFPLGSYKQVFLNTESSHVGATVSVLSDQLLVDDKIIDQTPPTRIKLAHSLAKQWFGFYVTPETSQDDWLVEGLAAYLTDQFVRRHLGNNALLYRRYKAFQAVCMADAEGAAPLSLGPDSGGDSEGVPNAWAKLGVEKVERSSIRTWKALAVLVMLEKRMGPDNFRKVLQRITEQAGAGNFYLTNKTFSRLARTIGGLDKRFLKAFFARWVYSPGCPRLQVAYVFVRKKNQVELALKRDATAAAETSVLADAGGSKEGLAIDTLGSYPGSLTLRVQEIEGGFEHHVALSGERVQLVELACHSKLSQVRRNVQQRGKKLGKKKKKKKAKKGQEEEGGGEEEEEEEEEEDPPPLPEPQGPEGLESPVLWLRVDPEQEHLLDLHLHQPEAMWAAQLDSDKDVIGQVQAIEGLLSIPSNTFTTVNALDRCLNNKKVFCYVRMEAALALGLTADESTGFRGLNLLLDFYRKRCYDPNINQPKPNDFSSIMEYYVNQAIPGAVALVRGSDGCSPLEAVKFLWELLKYNDNTKNVYSDSHWLVTVIEAVAALKLSKQSRESLLPKLLKQLDRYLQYGRIVPSYQHIVTSACLQTTAALACQLRKDLTTKDRLSNMLALYIHPLRPPRERVAGWLSLLELEVYHAGLPNALLFLLQAINRSETPKVLKKLLQQGALLWAEYEENATGGGPIIVPEELLPPLGVLLNSPQGWSNERLRHAAFKLLQRLGGRPATLYRPTTRGGLSGALEDGGGSLGPPASSRRSGGRRVSLTNKTTLRIALPLGLRTAGTTSEDAGAKKTASLKLIYKRPLVKGSMEEGSEAVGGQEAPEVSELVSKPVVKVEAESAKEDAQPDVTKATPKSRFFEGGKVGGAGTGQEEPKPEEEPMDGAIPEEEPKEEAKPEEEPKGEAKPEEAALPEPEEPKPDEDVQMKVEVAPGGDVPEEEQRGVPRGEVKEEPEEDVSEESSGDEKEKGEAEKGGSGKEKKRSRKDKYAGMTAEQVKQAREERKKKKEERKKRKEEKKRKKEMKKEKKKSKRGSGAVGVEVTADVALADVAPADVAPAEVAPAPRVAEATPQEEREEGELFSPERAEVPKAQAEGAKASEEKGQSLEKGSGSHKRKRPDAKESGHGEKRPKIELPPGTSSQFVPGSASKQESAQGGLPNVARTKSLKFTFKPMLPPRGDAKH